MIDLLLEAFEKLVDLVKYRQARDEKQFVVFVEQAFQSLNAVHKDYLVMFSQLQMQIHSSHELKDAINQLRSARVVYEAERRGILAQCQVLLGESGLRKFHPFFAAVIAYLQPVDIEPWNTPSMKLLEMLRAGSSGVVIVNDRDFTYTDGTRRYHFDELVEKHTSQLRERWARVCESYAKVKADVNA